MEPHTKSTHTEIPTEHFPIQFTEKAHKMASLALSAAGNGGEALDLLRVSVRGGGCAGLQYSLDLDNQASPYDLITHLNGLRVVADIFSLRYLAHTTVDYVESLEGAGFRFDNPNARRTCGCGSSFSS